MRASNDAKVHAVALEVPHRPVLGSGLSREAPALEVVLAQEQGAAVAGAELAVVDQGLRLVSSSRRTRLLIASRLRPTLRPISALLGPRVSQRIATDRASFDRRQVVPGHVLDHPELMRGRRPRGLDQAY
jgi:hypothetical protein